MASSPSSRLLSYGSVVLDRDDFDLLLDGQWLNDRLITFATEYLMDQLNVDEREKMELVCASTCEMLKFSPEFTTWLADYRSRSLVFFVVNNNRDPTRPGGSHWSLLIYDKERNRFSYLDSLYNPNKEDAEAIMNAAAVHLCPPGTKLHLNVLTCPKQENTHDCGVMVIEFVRFMLKHGRQSAAKALEKLSMTRMDAGYMRECRTNWRTIVCDLVKREETRMKKLGEGM
ncbi:hypothetical protein PFISCL1PPCAC_15384 [Pristionchus fissidentatus]|uniref:Ubiquitin-like protease family profile domain-containing protein n=1 Tax=Pristionchus fissidentatus TaxID=1538716 RepID=A0AAV5W1U4_9BILA|nr:hypothetical protein PFISCL1PPCAC_15384 [Pristionchus fissidentatus]